MDMSNSEPPFVHTLSSGAEPSDADVSPHPEVVEDVERQIHEMELARAEAAVSSRDYLIT